MEPDQTLDGGPRDRYGTAAISVGARLGVEICKMTVDVVGKRRATGVDGVKP